ncbi:molybdopterin cofactor-binding domain-containing protein [Caldilinea sp.]|uniref:molybdopterin-dependent oxidoreductase n=1 Tax=Caldilinea sp. TaxID=2293560 RepID=UPI0021DD2DE5|nr:molybdopterin cofactor-binding domain-containing protein [Caldilinea sp.]GIV70789.1 MAG: selenate reductase subunit YgfN [Caldilinea sp.]
MNIHLTLNGVARTLACEPGETLLSVLRRNGVWSVKHGCETGECGACSVLLDGKLTPTCVMLAAQADGHALETVEALDRGPGAALHPIQQAFAETGAIQCGYCTPAMVLAAKELLSRTPTPTEAEIRDALGGVLCRCTGYVKPVEAVQRAAAILRGEAVPPIDAAGGVPLEGFFDAVRRNPEPDLPGPGDNVLTKPKVALFTFPTVDLQGATEVVGKPEVKVDAVKLVKGKPAFADDFDLPGMLHAAMLTSPHAHARIKRIDASKARALPGVHAVLTYQDVPRVIYASGGQSWPNPHPWDQVSLDSKVRHVGDRVAVVAAESPEIAREALKLIEVEYEVLPAVFDPLETMKPGAPIIHDEPDAVGIADAEHNIAVKIHAAVGDVEKALAESDYVFERTYRVHQVQQASIEPHVVVTYWDEDERLVIRTSTQVPFHVRRMIAPLIGLPVKRIRVIKPRIGGGFGGKQEMLIEDLCAHLTIATGRPVRFEYTRAQEFTSARSRHPMVITFRAGVMRDGTLHALDMHTVSNTGAYGTHGLTVCSVAGLRGLATYRCNNLRFDAQVVYTNIPTPGAFRGYGAPQGEFALESLMEEIAEALNLDPVEFRLKNAVRSGDPIPITAALGEGEAGRQPQIVQSCGLEQCVTQGAAAIAWDRRGDPAWRVDPKRPYIRRGLGMAVCMHGTAIPGLDMGAASVKMNDDGSFNVLVGGTDLGTGSDTVLAQIAAETLGVPLNDIIIYSSDTDFTPFDTGAYASSTTYISGGAVKKAAEQVREQILERAKMMLKLETTEGLHLRDRCVVAPDGRSVTLADIALNSLHVADQKQIMATASHMSLHSPPPFGAQYAEVEVDTQTGQVTVTKLVMAVDCGTAINPRTAQGQIEGGLVQALGYAVSEEMAYDEQGRVLTTRFGDYRIFQANEVPEIEAILVPTYEPSGPYGAKAVAEIPMDGVAPAVANAVYDAVGVRIRDLPLTPEKVWRALQNL